MARRVGEALARLEASVNREFDQSSGALKNVQVCGADLLFLIDMSWSLYIFRFFFFFQPFFFRKRTYAYIYETNPKSNSVTFIFLHFFLRRSNFDTKYASTLHFSSPPPFPNSKFPISADWSFDTKQSATTAQLHPPSSPPLPQR